MPTYIHHNHSRWMPPYAMRVSIEYSKMDGRCNVKASVRYACRLHHCAALHLVQRPYISCVIYRRSFQTNICLFTVPFERDSTWNYVSKTMQKFININFSLSLSFTHSLTHSFTHSLTHSLTFIKSHTLTFRTDVNFFNYEYFKILKKIKVFL